MPLHTDEFFIGEYRNQMHLIKGRTLTIRGVEVRRCGCQVYPAMRQMLDLLQAHPRRKVVTWHPRLMKWK